MEKGSNDCVAVAELQCRFQWGPRVKKAGGCKVQAHDAGKCSDVQCCVAGQGALPPVLRALQALDPVGPRRVLTSP